MIERSHDGKHGVKHNRRTGTVLLCVLAALSVVTALSAAAIGQTLRNRAERRSERDRVQLEFLCDAGWKRALREWNRDPEYAGEEWLAMPGTIDGTTFRVSIGVESQPATNSTEPSPRILRSLTVRARIEGRSQSPPVIQRTRTWNF
jgi:hypothetical protein